MRKRRYANLIDPFIKVIGGLQDGVTFSAWDYAKDRCSAMAMKPDSARFCMTRAEDQGGMDRNLDALSRKSDARSFISRPDPRKSLDSASPRMRTSGDGAQREREHEENPRIIGLGAELLPPGECRGKSAGRIIFPERLLTPRD